MNEEYLNPRITKQPPFKYTYGKIITIIRKEHRKLIIEQLTKRGVKFTLTGEYILFSARQKNKLPRDPVDGVGLLPINDEGTDGYSFYRLYELDIFTDYL